MSKFNSFEDILSWQKARIIVNEIYSITKIGSFSKDYSLKDQTRSAAISIMLNIAEGFGRKSNKEFIQFLVIAHGSASEVQSALYIALDQQYLSKNSFDKLYTHCSEISKMIMGLIKYLKENSRPKQFQKT
jgi:four helix bundle protein